MKAIPTTIPDVLIIEPNVFGDERGFFFESFNQPIFLCCLSRNCVKLSTGAGLNGYRRLTRWVKSDLASIDLPRRLW